LADRCLPKRCHPRLRLVIGSRMSSTMNARRLSTAMTDGLLKSAEQFLNRVEAVA
jgi:hypothetical protein